jgi:homoserine acetyltransferase
MTIRDNVDAVYRLVTTELHVKHLRAVVGFSMGAEQAFQWAVSHPDFMDAIVATSGTAKCYGHGFVRLEGQIAALTTDPVWQGGDYTTPPAKGLEAFSMGGPDGCTRRSGGARNCGARRRRPEPPSIRRCRDSGSASALMRTITSCRREHGSATTSAPRQDSTAA